MGCPKDPIKRSEWIRKQKLSQIGQKRSDESKKNMSIHHPANNPLKREKFCKTISNTSTQQGDKNSNYKGDLAGYDAIHEWVRKRKIKSEVCERCGSSTKIVLACIGEYKRDINQFAWLCWSCQSKDDLKNPKHPEKLFPKKFKSRVRGEMVEHI